MPPPAIQGTLATTCPLVTTLQCIGVMCIYGRREHFTNGGTLASTCLLVALYINDWVAYTAATES